MNPQAYYSNCESATNFVINLKIIIIINTQSICPSDLVICVSQFPVSSWIPH